MSISFVLNCISMGGPVNQMMWLLDGAPVPNSSLYPILADAEEGLYYNTLSVYGRKVGNYSCIVTDGLNFSSAGHRSIQGEVYIHSA